MAKVSQLPTAKGRGLGMVETMQKLTRQRLSEPTCIELQEQQDTSLILPSSAEPLNATFPTRELSPMHIVEGKSYPRSRRGVPNRNKTRVPVVDAENKPLMPCTAARARALLNAGKAIAKRSKLQIFYIQLKLAKTPSNQPLVLGVDPGSKF